VLLYSVLVFIVVPLVAGVLLRQWFVRTRGTAWFEAELLPRFAPISMLARLATLVLIFAFQANNILGKPVHVALIAAPILIQVYFNSSLTYGLMRLLRVEYAIAAPGALISASNFFELAVATAIALFGPESGAALATVVGVLIRGAGHALRVRRLQPHAPLVSSARQHLSPVRARLPGQLEVHKVLSSIGQL